MNADIWPVHVINLAANTVRMDRVRTQLAGQGIAFTRLEAVNGWDLSDQEIAEVYDADANARRGKHDLVPAEIGCYLSHIAAWRAIAASKADGGVVLEDDFNAGADLAAVLTALCGDPQPPWGIAKLICIHDDPQIISTAPLTAGYALSYPYKIPTMGLGYMLTKVSAKALLASALPFFRPVDEDHKFFWEHGQRIALVQPNPLLLGEQEAATGTIGDARRSRAKRQGWRKLRYQLSYQLCLRWHRLKGMR